MLRQHLQGSRWCLQVLVKCEQPTKKSKKMFLFQRMHEYSEHKLNGGRGAPFSEEADSKCTPPTAAG